MSQEPDNGKASTETKVEKLSIDRSSDFRFHAAYLVYSEAWDRASSSDVKAQLNQIITSLSKDEIDTETFYRQISQYRGQGASERYSFGGKTRIETSRKKEWRKREAKSARESRHRR
jgi:hypothetical protein